MSIIFNLEYEHRHYTLYARINCTRLSLVASIKNSPSTKCSPQVPVIGVNDSIDDVTVVMMPLKRPSLEADGPLQVLVDRSPWDKSAKTFVRDRRRFIDNQREPTDTVKDKLSSFFKFLGHGAESS